MAKPRKPKMLGYPKKPKSKTIKSMENYLTRVKYIEKENSRRAAKYNTDIKKWTVLKDRVARA